MRTIDKALLLVAPPILYSLVLDPAVTSCVVDGARTSDVQLCAVMTGTIVQDPVAYVVLCVLAWWALVFVVAGVLAETRKRRALLGG